MQIRLAVLIVGGCFLCGCGEDEPPPRPDVRPSSVGAPAPKARLKGRARLQAMCAAFEKREPMFDGRALDGFEVVRALLRYPGINKKPTAVDPDDMELVKRLPDLLVEQYKPPAQFTLAARYKMSLQLVAGLLHEHRHIRTMTIDALRRIYSHDGNAYDPDAPRDYLIQRQAVWTRYIQEQAQPPK